MASSAETQGQALIARSKTLVNVDLKRICKEEGMIVSGNKAQLQARVIASMDSHSLLLLSEVCLFHLLTAVVYRNSASYIWRRRRSSQPPAISPQQSRRLALILRFTSVQLARAAFYACSGQRLWRRPAVCAIPASAYSWKSVLHSMPISGPTADSGQVRGYSKTVPSTRLKKCCSATSSLIHRQAIARPQRAR
jgi:hypothetical protein